MGLALPYLGAANYLSGLPNGQRPGMYSALDTYGRKPARDFTSIWQPGKMGKDKTKILTKLGNQQAKAANAAWKNKKGAGYSAAGMPNMEIL